MVETRILKRQDNSLPFDKEELSNKRKELADDLRDALKAQAIKLAPHFPTVEEVEVAGYVYQAGYTKGYTDEKRYGDKGTLRSDLLLEGHIAHEFEISKDSSDPLMAESESVVFFLSSAQRWSSDIKIGIDKYGRLISNGLTDWGGSDNYVLKYAPEYLMTEDEIREKTRSWHLSKGVISETRAILTDEFFTSTSKGYARKYHDMDVLPTLLAGVPKDFYVDGTLPNKLWDRIKIPAIPLGLRYLSRFEKKSIWANTEIQKIWQKERKIKRLEKKYADKMLSFVLVEGSGNSFSKLSWGMVLLGDLFRDVGELENIWQDKGLDHERKQMAHRALRLISPPLGEQKPYLYQV